MFGVLVHSQGILGPGEKSSFMMFIFVPSQAVPGPGKVITLWCWFALCNLKPFLDLEIFPQISQEWEILLVM